MASTMDTDAAAMRGDLVKGAQVRRPLPELRIVKSHLASMSQWCRRWTKELAEGEEVIYSRHPAGPEGPEDDDDDNDADGDEKVIFLGTASECGDLVLTYQ